ncbi:hypothetical protein JCM10908_002907 [Rhodotorula pacifica]|uniref:uncharacterized protein n=1 Tax=Rhodotorula pacifica TaxID=1495444 RepID=UPI00316BA5DA
MPSIKAVLVSLALSALALAPVAQASPVKANQVLARRSSPSFFSDDAAVGKRSESRKDLAARVKRAKLAAARKVKRQRTTWAQRQQAAAPAAAAPATAAPVSSAAGDGGAYAPGSPFLSTPQALAATNVRCGTSFVCNAQTTPPANAASLCLSGRCTFRCNTGFAPGGADGTQCVQGATTCGTQTCQVPDGGYALCAGDACSYGCNDGLSLITATGQAPRCISLDADASNCGAVGNTCPPSYNGQGSPVCRFGVCRLACPAGSFERATLDGSATYCYGG